MKKSVSQQLVKFFQENPTSVFPSGEIQRMPWFNKNDTPALPRTLVRRLQELAEEGTIQVSYQGQNTLYGANKAKIPPPKPKPQIKIINGEAVAVLVNN